MLNLSLTTLVARGIVLLTALPIHEAAHAWTAEKMGDSTARYNHRLTLNPLDHVDPIGAVMILLFGVGFAKPVPVNSAAFRDRKKGMLFVSLAGPLSNVVLAWASLILYKLLIVVAHTTGLQLAVGADRLFSIMVSTNLGLAVFNLLPIPPLDGWHAIMPFLPYETTWIIQQYEHYIVWGVLALLWLGAFDRIVGVLVSLLYVVVDSATFFMDFLIRAVA